MKSKSYNSIDSANKQNLNILSGPYTYLTYLAGRPDLLTPRVHITRGRTGVSLVIGISSIRRDGASYLHETLKSLFDNMDENDKRDTLVVLSLAEIEDDLKVQEDFVQTIKNSTIEYSPFKWEFLQFSVLGFIGKLFPAKSIPVFAELLLMYYSHKPCDWLILDFLRVKLCSLEENEVMCQVRMQLASPFKEGLFQHMGDVSSLTGVLKYYKDDTFKENDANPNVQDDTYPIAEDDLALLEILSSISEYASESPINNPDFAGASTTLAQIGHSFVQLYNMGKLCLVINPKHGDILEFVYNPPIQIKRISISTGIVFEDEQIFKLKDANIEILPEIYSIPITQEKESIQNKVFSEVPSPVPAPPTVWDFEDVDELFSDDGETRKTTAENQMQLEKPPLLSLKSKAAAGGLGDPVGGDIIFEGDYLKATPPTVPLLPFASPLPDPVVVRHKLLMAWSLEKIPKQTEYDNFLTLCSLAPDTGAAVCQVPSELGPIRAFRIRVTADAEMSVFNSIKVEQTVEAGATEETVRV
ncbi:hypothetical protein PoB_001048400 [Plakobranchus ocellatus]|uniref:MGAT4 conserved region domain-containing protein n=1 Tax=Plakobranchus ocellatus TaxID=259542 RepID=A0AAV3YPL5_9GAST|nr:hypothetical protein PoB_001048400 [Plakobranchus ocellatus]